MISKNEQARALVFAVLRQTSVVVVSEKPVGDAPDDHRNFAATMLICSGDQFAMRVAAAAMRDQNLDEPSQKPEWANRRRVPRSSYLSLWIIIMVSAATILGHAAKLVARPWHIEYSVPGSSGAGLALKLWLQFSINF